MVCEHCDREYREHAVIAPPDLPADEHSEDPAPFTEAELQELDRTTAACSPGAWAADIDDATTEPVWTGKFYCGERLDGQGCAWCTYWGEDSAEVVANARLCAAAPRLLATVKAHAERIATLTTEERRALADRDDWERQSVADGERVAELGAELAAIRAAVDASSDTSTLNAVRYKAWRCATLEQSIDNVSATIGRLDALTQRRDGEALGEAVERTLRAHEQLVADLEDRLAVANQQIAEVRAVVQASETEETALAVRRALLKYDKTLAALHPHVRDLEDELQEAEDVGPASTRRRE